MTPKQRLLTDSSSGFRFKVGQRVKARNGDGRHPHEGTIVEGILTEHGVFYEIKSEGENDCRFAAREEDLEKLEVRRPDAGQELFESPE